MSTSSLPDGDAQTSAFFRDCTPAQECSAAIEKSDLRVRRFWELVSEGRNFATIIGTGSLTRAAVCRLEIPRPAGENAGLRDDSMGVEDFQIELLPK
jgi:hypothetical protein